MAEELLLEGIKVLEVSSWIAAPSCGAMLADRGAQVTKVEPPEVGDAYRIYYDLPPSPNSEVNYLDFGQPQQALHHAESKIGPRQSHTSSAGGGLRHLHHQSAVALPA